MDPPSKIIKHEIHEWTGNVAIPKESLSGVYFRVGNILAWVNFNGTMSYSRIIKSIKSWEIPLRLNSENDSYYMNEIQKCSLREVEKLNKIFSQIISEQREQNTTFLISLQNACTNIINSQKYV